MKKILFFILFLFIPFLIYAADRAQLDDGNGNIMGTSANPVHVNCVSGCGSSSQWLNTNVGIGTYSNVGIGTVNTSSAALLVQGSPTSLVALNEVGGSVSNYIIQSSTNSNDTIGTGAVNSQNVSQTFTFSPSQIVSGACFTLGADTGSPAGTITVSINITSAGVTTNTLANASLTTTITPTPSSQNCVTFPSTTLSSGVYSEVLSSTNTQSANNSWNVLISTTNPYSGGAEYTSANGGAWTIAGTNDLEFTIQAYTSQNNPQLQFQSSGSATGFIETNGGDNNNLELGTGSTQMAITTGGNVGVGSITPGQALDVVGTVRATGFTGNASNVTNLPLTLTTTGSSGASTWTQSTDTLNIPQYSGGSSSQWTYTSSGNIGLSTTSTVGIGTTGGVGGLLVMNGNVGIGTWNPGASLSVMNGNIGIGTTVTTAPIEMYASSLPAGASEILQDMGNNNNSLEVGNSTAQWTFSVRYSGDANPGGFNFYATTNNGGSYTNAMNITTAGNVTLPAGTLTEQGTGGSSFVGNVGLGTTITSNAGLSVMNGNVGIGTWVPGQALDVQGTVRALSTGACSYLYKCVGGVDAGVIQTSACNLCPAGSCTQMNLCG